MVNVGDIIEHITIEAIGAEGQCIAKSPEGKIIFVKHGAPGDVVDLRIYKREKRFFLADIVQLHQPSPHRTTPACHYAGTCGGCQWQQVDYATQLQAKQQQVLDQLTRIGKLDLPPMRPILGSDPIYHYRNKLDFAFANKKWLRKEDLGTQSPENGLGFHIAGRFDKVLDIDTCHLMPEPANAIKNTLRTYALEQGLSFYDYRAHTGDLRGLILRRSNTGQWMVIVIFGYAPQDTRQALLQHLHSRFPELHSLLYVINHKKNDTIYDLPVHHYHGHTHIWEQMEDLTFRVGPQSFYQTNAYQAHRLYTVARDLARIEPHHTVYDLYTGTGTIALFVARQAAKVVGIEYVESAIEDARFNANHNHITNTSFHAGDMAKLFTPAFIDTHGRPDIIITDPPRGGMHESVIQTLLRLETPRIVYVSCNPATQARDVQLLSAKYAITAIQPVDMFPHTYHVENVMCLELR